MGVLVWLDPTTVNVLTDVYLLIVNILWVQLLEFLTALSLKRSLRKGRRLFSFETLGGWKCVKFGWRKWRYLQKNEGSEENPQKGMPSALFFAIASLLFTVTIVFMHILIDNGLDFSTQLKLQEEKATYAMTSLAANPSVVKEMSEYENLATSVSDCLRAGRSYNDCRRDADLRGSLLVERLREYEMFAKSFYGMSSVGQLDIVESVELEHISVDPLNKSKKNQFCLIKEERNLVDYYGTITTSAESGQGSCALRGSVLRRLEIDMRATQISRKQPISRLSAQDFKIFSYRSFKDEQQKKSSMSLKRVPDAIRRNAFHVIQLDVNSEVFYEPGDQQRMRLTDLSKRSFGLFGDPRFTVELTRSSHESSTLEGLPCRDASNFSEGSATLNLNVTILFTPEGSEDTRSCGTYPLRGVLDNCRGMNALYQHNNGTDVEDRERRFGFQKFEAVRLLDPESDECARIAAESFEDQLWPNLDAERRLLFMSFQLEIACTEKLDGSGLECIYGPNAITWNELSGFQLPDESPFEKPTVIPIRSLYAWLSAEIIGGDLGKLEDVRNAIGRTLSDHYGTLRIFSSRSATRGLFLGSNIPFAMRDMIASISPHIQAAERTVKIFAPQEVAELNPTYFIGLLIVTVPVILLTLFAAVRYFYEKMAYSRIQLEVDIPRNATDWIATAIACMPGFPMVEGKQYAIAYKCKGVLPPEHETSSPDAKHGTDEMEIIFESPEADQKTSDQVSD